MLSNLTGSLLWKLKNLITFFVKIDTKFELLNLNLEWSRNLIISLVKTECKSVKISLASIQYKITVHKIQ